MVHVNNAIDVWNSIVDFINTKNNINLKKIVNIGENM